MANNRVFNLYEQKQFAQLERLLQTVHPDSEIKNGSTLLHKICQHVQDGDEQYVELLLKHKAEPNKNVLKMGVPLIGVLNSVMAGSASGALPKVANLLLEHGANVNCTPKALQMVAYGTKENAVDMIYVLLKYGVCQVNKNDAGETPLVHARTRAANPAKYGVHDLRLLGNVIKALEYGLANYPLSDSNTQSKATERRRAILQRYDAEAKQRADALKIIEIAKKQAEAVRLAEEVKKQTEALARAAEEKKLADAQRNLEVAALNKATILKEKTSHAEQIAKLEQDRADKIRLMIDSKHDFGTYGAFKLFYNKHKNLDLAAFQEQISTSKSVHYATLMNIIPPFATPNKVRAEFQPWSQKKAILHCKLVKNEAIADAILHQTKTDDPVSGTLNDMHKALDKHRECKDRVNEFYAISNIRKHPARVDMQSTTKEENDRADKINCMINSKCDFGSYDAFKLFYYKYKELDRNLFQEQIKIESTRQQHKKQNIEDARTRREQQYADHRQEKKIEQQMQAARIAASGLRHQNTNQACSKSKNSSSSLSRSLDQIVSSNSSRRQKIFDTEISSSTSNTSGNTSMQYKTKE